MRLKLPKQVKQNGFTLIELLVAISVLAIIAVMGWAGLDGIIRARTTLNAELEQSRSAQIIFVQLENDSAHIASAWLLPLRENLFASQNQLVLVRQVNQENQASKLQIVAYRLQDNVLTRRESIATRDLLKIDADWQSAINGSDDMPIVKLHSNIAAIEMRTWDIRERMWRIAGSDVNDSLSLPAKDGTPQQINKKIGLEVLMRLQGSENPILKIFLLGAT